MWCVLFLSELVWWVGVFLDPNEGCWEICNALPEELRQLVIQNSGCRAQQPCNVRL